MKNAVIRSLSNPQRKKIKEVVKFHYGIDAEDHDVDWIDRMLRNSYSTLHYWNVLRNLLTVNIGKILLKHREKIGTTKFETITTDKMIFRYLTFASTCYREGIPMATIHLCRTAIETGLRERIAEERAKNEINDIDDLSQKIWEFMEKLERKQLKDLIKIAEDSGILERGEIERVFKSLKLGEQPSRKVLDKFIHGDIAWIVKFVESRRPTQVIGARDVLDEKKITAMSQINDVAVITLIATTRIAERLYF